MPAAMKKLHAVRADAYLAALRHPPAYFDQAFRLALRFPLFVNGSPNKALDGLDRARPEPSSK